MSDDPGGLANMKRLAPGVYDDGNGGMHLDVAEMLEANGYAPTDENIATLADAARNLADELGLEIVE